MCKLYSLPLITYVPSHSFSYLSVCNLDYVNTFFYIHVCTHSKCHPLCCISDVCMTVPCDYGIYFSGGLVGERFECQLCFGVVVTTELIPVHGRCLLLSTLPLQTSERVRCMLKLHKLPQFSIHLSTSQLLYLSK